MLVITVQLYYNIIERWCYVLNSNSSKNYTQFRLCLHNVTDSDVIEKLKSTSNKQGYIKELIRKDIGTYKTHKDKNISEVLSTSKSVRRGRKAIDITGQRFGKWKVIEKTDKKSGPFFLWKCICNCGNIGYVTSQALRAGKSKGCQKCKYKDENSKKKSDNTERHIDGKKTKAYCSWQAIRARCYNKNHTSYKNYGGRGIIMCEEWYNNYHSFYQYVSNLPDYEKEGYTIDRINNDGNYEPGNVRWASPKMQTNNRRKV